MLSHTRAGTLMLAVAGSLAAVAQEPDLLAMPDKARAPSASGVKDEVIAQAVRETLAESKAGTKDRQGTTSATFAPKGTMSGDKYEEFGRTFSEAQRPGCLQPDALKHQQTTIVTKNWTFSVGGIMLLPLWAKAIVSGKCN